MIALLLALFPVLALPSEPDLAALQWLPDASTACQQRAFCHDRAIYLRTQLEMERLRHVDLNIDNLDAQLCYALYCESAWEDLCFAQNTSWQLHDRVTALDRLQKTIGMSDFASGKMPCPWRYFAWIK